LRQAGLPQLVQLGETLHAGRQEIGAMRRFTRNNGITDGSHNKMELDQLTGVRLSQLPKLQTQS